MIDDEGRIKANIGYGSATRIAGGIGIASRRSTIDPAT